MFGSKQIRICLPLCALTLLSAFGLQASQTIVSPGTPVEAWSTLAGSAPPVVTDSGVVFACDFSGGEDRFYWDLVQEINLSGYDGLMVDFGFENSSAFRAVTLHLQSGDGWYAATLPISEPSQSFFVPFDSFEVQGEPAGWESITSFRVSPWKGDSATGRFILEGVQAKRTLLLLIDPDEASSPTAPEREYGLGLSKWLAAQFLKMGEPATRLADSVAATADLDRYDVILFPYNPQPSTALLKRLSSYLADGGRLVVFYSASPDLARLAGFKPGRYLSAPSPHSWSVISFEGEGWSGPIQVYQPGTRNVMVVPETGGVDVLAWWADAAGNRQRESAVVMSDNALWFSAVLTPENEMDKRKMLAFAVDRLQPKLGLANSAVISHFRNVRARSMVPWEDFLRDVDVDNGLKNRAERIEDLITNRHAGRAWEAVDALAREMDARVAATFTPTTSGMRGVWDHTGNGFASGNWEETFSVLGTAGLTDYFLFTSRHSPVPLEALTAAETAGIGIHAWHICFNLHGVSPLQVRRYERDNRLQINQYGDVLPWLCPANEQNQRMELRRLNQLAETRGVKGVHLDYLRWPDGVYCTCSNCKTAFTEFVGGRIDWPREAIEGRYHASFLEWRSQLLSKFLETASGQLRDQSSSILLSAAVWPAYPEVINRLGQNWNQWIQENWLDFVVPMNYTNSRDQFKEWTRSQVRLVLGPQKMVAGIGYTSSESRLTPAQVLDQIALSDSAGAYGYVLFDLDPAFQSELAPVLKRIYESGATNE
jgi:hypothetical protein